MSDTDPDTTTAAPTDPAQPSDPAGPGDTENTLEAAANPSNTPVSDPAPAAKEQ